MQDTSIVYKLMVLYLLKTAGYELTNSDICDYVLMKDYTDSLTLQIVITDLVNDKMIEEKRKNNRTYLELTGDGRDTIDALEGRLANEIKRDIYTYISVNDKKIRSEHALQTEIVEMNSAYEARLSVRERDENVMELRISFPSEELARSACDKFADGSSDIYKYILEKLL